MNLSSHDFRQLGRDAPSWRGKDTPRRLAERVPANLEDPRDRLHPGRHLGAPGSCRNHKPSGSAVLDRSPERYAACARSPAVDAPGLACAGHDEAAVRSVVRDNPGLPLWASQHRFWEPRRYAHCRRHQPLHAVVLSEDEGAGVDHQPMPSLRLAGLLVIPCQRCRRAHSRVQELPRELLGRQVRAGLADQTLRQGAGKAAPVQELRPEEIARVGVLHRSVGLALSRRTTRDGPTIRRPIPRSTTCCALRENA